MVFSDLTLSKTTKLKEVYRSDEIAAYLDEAKASLWFLDDSGLFMSYVSSSRYSDFALLKSSLLLDMYISVQNTRMLKDKLEDLLVDLEQVSVN